MTLKELFYGSDKFTAAQEKQRMFAMYFISGIATTMANFTCFVLFDKLVTGQHPVTIFRWEFDLFLLLNQVIAWIVCVLTAFFTNRAWVFRSKGNVLLELLGFTCARLFSFLTIEIGLFTVMVMFFQHSLGIGTDDLIVEILGFDLTYLYLIKMLNSIVLVAVNFLASKLLVFRRGRQRPEDRLYVC